MLKDFFSHCYKAPVQFGRVGDALLISNDSADSRGSWIAWWDGAVTPGQTFQLLGTYEGGQIKALFFRTYTEFMSSVVVEPGAVFEVPEEAALLRLDCRFWDAAGRAVFQNIQVVEYGPTAAAPLLPLPAPDLLEERYWVGYKWGRNIFIMDSAGEGPAIPVDRGDAYEVTGSQRGRDIYLKVGNIITAEGDDS
jgi:hypothetical protein